MRLAPRLVLAFGTLTIVSTAGLGFVVRNDRVAAETRRFQGEVEQACKNVQQELSRQAEADRKLVANACTSGELVDHLAVAIEAGNQLEQMQLAFHDLVPHRREAFGIDELMLAPTQGAVIGADPHALLAAPRDEIERALRGPQKSFALRTGGTPAV